MLYAVLVPVNPGPLRRKNSKGKSDVTSRAQLHFRVFLQSTATASSSGHACQPSAYDPSTVIILQIVFTQTKILTRSIQGMSCLPWEMAYRNLSQHCVKIEYELDDNGRSCYDTFLMVRNCCCAERSGDSYLNALQDMWATIQGDCDRQRRERQGKPQRDFCDNLELANTKGGDVPEEHKRSEKEATTDQDLIDEVARKA